MVNYLSNVKANFVGATEFRVVPSHPTTGELNVDVVDTVALWTGLLTGVVSVVLAIVSTPVMPINVPRNSRLRCDVRDSLDARGDSPCIAAPDAQIVLPVSRA